MIKRIWGGGGWRGREIGWGEERDLILWETAKSRAALEGDIAMWACEWNVFRNKQMEKQHECDSQIFNSCFMLQVLSNARLVLENLLRWVTSLSKKKNSSLFRIPNKVLPFWIGILHAWTQCVFLTKLPMTLSIKDAKQKYSAFY